MDIVIRNEAEAWEWLNRGLEGEIDTDEPINIRFDGWPTLDLKFTGHDFDQSVPTRVMPPLLDAQREIHRLYCQLAYGQQNLRKLTNEDRDRLELNIRVEKGSSDYSTNLSDVLNEAIKSAVSNMDSVHILIASLSVGLMWASNVAWKNWLQKKERDKEVESRIRMSELEKEKLEILSKSQREIHYIKDLSKGVDDFRNDSLHKMKPNDTFSVPDSEIDVDGRYAAEITHKPREKSVEKRIDGEFTILSVISGDTKGFRLKVKRVLDDTSIHVTIPPGTLSSEQKNILKDNEWAKKPVLLEINAKELRGQITSATLVSASRIERAEES